jgi:hypothetical protein
VSKSVINKDNKDKKNNRPIFTQVFKGFSRVFRILPKGEEEKYIEKEILTSEFLDKDGRRKQITVTYFGLQQDAYALRLFLNLIAKVSVNKKNFEINNDSNNTEAELIEATDKNNADIVEKLRYVIEPREKSDLTKLPKIETNYKEICDWLELTYDNKNIRRIERILEKLQVAAIKIVIKDLQNKMTKKVYSNLFLWQSNEYRNRNQHKISIVFNPIAYLVISEIELRSTVNLEIVRQLSKKDINKVVLFYVVSDRLKFGEKDIIPFSAFYSLWTTYSQDKRIKHKRKKFILETFKEIEELSKGSFKFEIDKDENVTIKRIPDRKVR